MRLTKLLLAVLLIAIGLFGVPWWADLAAESVPAPEPKPVAAPAVASRPQATEQASGSQELWVDVDQEQQVVTVYAGDQPVKVMRASTGINSAPTPNGLFRVMNRGEWFYSEEFQQGAYYWVGLDEWGEYLFHSVPYTRERQLIKDEADLLGQRASHGCIRLSLEDAKWMHDHIPAGAKVVIHD